MRLNELSSEKNQKTNKLMRQTLDDEKSEQQSHGSKQIKIRLIFFDSLHDSLF